MLVSEIMATNVITIGSEDTVLEACKRYYRHRIGCLVVVDDKKMVGIVTERDIISRVIITQKNPEQTLVEDIMTKDVKTVLPTSGVKEAADMMGKNGIKKLPVISDTGDLLGIITITDIANIVPNSLKSAAEGENGSFRYAQNAAQQV